MKDAGASIDGQAPWRPTIAIVPIALLAVFVCATTPLGVVRAWAGAPHDDLWHGAIALMNGRGVSA